MGTTPDYVRLAEEILGIRNAPPALAQTLVSQALVIEDRREQWLAAGARIAAAAPAAPGVYALRAGETVLYVGKATNLRRRLQSHFAPRRWPSLPPSLARVDNAEWRVVGSELEALLREMEWIAEFEPPVNTQIAPPALATREIPSRLVRDVIAVLPSVESDSVELVGARVIGATVIQRSRRNGADLAVHAERLWKFFRGRPVHSAATLSPIVYSWLARRGSAATWIDAGDLASARDLRARLQTLFDAGELFAERIVVVSGSDARRRRGR
jgi:hypothetical protein